MVKEREKEVETRGKSDDGGGKATLRGRNSREVRPVRRCDADGRGLHRE